MLGRKDGERIPESLFKKAGVDREEFELACIREFSHSGLHLGLGVSRTERRERIGAAILREGKAQLRWRDSDSTYAEVFAQVYRQSLDSSAIHEARPAPARFPFPNSMIHDEVDDDEEAFEGDDGHPA
jgi:hypothetical protein